MNYFANPKSMARLHAVLTMIWIAAVIPTLLWWKDSILWVGLMSCWANIASHWACHAAAKAEIQAKKK